MTSHPAGFSSSEEDDDFDEFGFEIEKPKTKYNYQPRVLTPNEKLIEAACSNDVNAAREALEEGADIHHRSNSSMNHTPIMKAASAGGFHVMEFLINQGANVNDEFEMFNVIMCLCNSYSFDEDNLLKCLNLLLDNGADPLAVDWIGTTSLMNAVRRGCQQLAARLIESGCSVNAADGEGWTPLFYAVQTGNVNMTKFLIESGANINVSNRYGLALWEHAAEKDNKDLSCLVTPEEYLESEDDAVQVHRPRTSQFKAMMSGAAKLDDRMCGYNEDTLRFMHGIGLDSVASQIEKKNIQFSELMTWKKQDWFNAGIQLSYPLKKIDLCVRKYHEKEWGKGSIPNVAQVVSKESEVVQLFTVVQVLLNCLRNAHINSASSLYISNNYEGPLTSEIQQELKNVMKSTLIIKRQVWLLKRLIREIDHPTLYPPDSVVRRRHTKRKELFNYLVVNCLYGFIRILFHEWNSS